MNQGEWAMAFRTGSGAPWGKLCMSLGCALTAGLAIFAVPASSQTKPAVLRIGTSRSMLGDGQAKKEKGAMETLKEFIKEETGMDNDILPQKDWREVAEKMAKKDLHLGVFQGYEFAWAREKYPELKPLALAINVYRYPVAHVVTLKESAAKDFKGLQGQTVAIPATGQHFLRLFLEREAETNGKSLEAFLGKVTTPETPEEALDELVTGKVQAVVADRASLDSYKRRKPGRFNKLKEVVHSQPFPPVVIAYYNQVLDTFTLMGFSKGVLEASKKEKGETILTLFRLSGFETPQEDFAKVLADTRKNYPPPDEGKKDVSKKQ